LTDTLYLYICSLCQPTSPPHVSSMQLVIRTTSTTMNPYGKTGRHSAFQKNSLSFMEDAFTRSWYSRENPFRILTSVSLALILFLISHCYRFFFEKLKGPFSVSVVHEPRCFLIRTLIWYDIFVNYNCVDTQWQ